MELVATNITLIVIGLVAHLSVVIRNMAVGGYR